MMHSGTTSYPHHVVKRYGQLAMFDATEIESALLLAGTVSGEFCGREAARLTAEIVVPRLIDLGYEIPHIEQIRDCVESALFDAGYRTALRAYIVHRERHNVRCRDRKTWLTSSAR